MHTRMRLGELLLASGLLSADQLEAALQGQRSSGMKLGEYLIKQGICRERRRGRRVPPNRHRTLHASRFR
ncbi:MAG: hypothetical protein ACLSAH_12055 [Bilophila wadsworthia]